MGLKKYIGQSAKDSLENPEFEATSHVVVKEAVERRAKEFVLVVFQYVSKLWIILVSKPRRMLNDEI